jgi:hypothetical protein
MEPKLRRCFHAVLCVQQLESPWITIPFNLKLDNGCFTSASSLTVYIFCNSCKSQPTTTYNQQQHRLSLAQFTVFKFCCQLYPSHLFLHILSPFPENCLCQNIKTSVPLSTRQICLCIMYDWRHHRTGKLVYYHPLFINPQPPLIHTLPYLQVLTCMKLECTRGV